MKAKKCDVTIFKSVEVSIAKTIYEHEIPVLEQIFGDGNVAVYKRHDLVFPKGKKYQVEAPDPVAYQVEEIDYEEEYFRLESAYGQKSGVDGITNVEYVYGKLADRKMEDRAKSKYKGNEVVEDQPGISEDLDEDNMDYQSMTNAELRELLRELNVKHSPTATKAILISLLKKSDQGQLEHK